MGNEKLQIFWWPYNERMKERNRSTHTLTTERGTHLCRQWQVNRTHTRLVNLLWGCEGSGRMTWCEITDKNTFMVVWDEMDLYKRLKYDTFVRLGTPVTTHTREMDTSWSPPLLLLSFLPPFGPGEVSLRILIACWWSNRNTAGFTAAAHNTCTGTQIHVHVHVKLTTLARHCNIVLWLP